jgi:pyruvate dehydrogenase E2 component (dihydrolipoamide acetyltransferase)
MAQTITIPRLGWNMEEGVFAGWLKPDGAEVRAGDTIFTLESDKATEDIESLDSGILRIAPGGPNPGDRIAVGVVIGYLVRAGEAIPDTPVTAVVKVAGAAQAGGATAPMRTMSGQVAGAAAISPRARRAARELGIDWTRLQGSGRTGRIRERDVRAAATTAVPSVGRQPPDQGAAAPVSPIRRTIAERMVASLRSTAPVTLTTTADATNLVQLREQFQAVGGAADGNIPSFTDFLVKLTALALQRHPLLNSRWESDAIVASPSIDIGIAVDTEKGLLVPVIRNVPALGLRQIAGQARALAERARQGKLQAADMQGGTFTITNLGPFGIDAFTPIINHPQSAILGVGRIQRRPVVWQDQIAARPQVMLSLTFDHRIVDGAPAARFLQALSRLVENPGPWLMP